MKKIIFLVVIVSIVCFTFVGCFDDTSPTVTSAESASKANAEAAQTANPVPILNYFQERKTIDKWARYWDKPNLPTYVYLFVFNNCIGYYVADGKPASTRSYLTPETNLIDDPHGSFDAGGQQVPAPDIDGTYGDNNPGIRFFTATGIPVEFGGAGASYLYSAYPLPINAPELSKK